jgi:hypothetical protein
MERTLGSEQLEVADKPNDRALRDYFRIARDPPTIQMGLDNQTLRTASFASG